MVGAFEGCDLTAKVDTVGTGHPLTWCHGETIGNAKPGEHFTKAQCDAMLEARLPSYWADIKPCIKVETSDNEKIAYTSTAYNIGARAFCHSAMASRLNAGNHQGACDALLSWSHAQGRFVPGLYKRRSEERKVCLTPDPIERNATDFCSGSGQGADCPRNMPWYRRILTLAWWME